MQVNAHNYCLIERRDSDRRQHFDRRDKARFEPQHPDRRDVSKRRVNRDDSPAPILTPKR